MQLQSVIYHCTYYILHIHTRVAAHSGQALPYMFEIYLDNLRMSEMRRYMFSRFFPRASERRVLLIVGVCYTFSHLLIFTSTHIIFKSSHLHISSSHLRIFTSTPYHLHTFTSSHLDISSSLLHIFPSSHLHISSSHLHIYTYHLHTSTSYPHISSSHLHIYKYHLHIFTSYPHISSSHLLSLSLPPSLSLSLSPSLSPSLSLSLSLSPSLSLSLCLSLSCPLSLSLSFFFGRNEVRSPKTEVSASTTTLVCVCV